MQSKNKKLILVFALLYLFYYQTAMAALIFSTSDPIPGPVTNPVTISFSFDDVETDLWEIPNGTETYAIELENYGGGENTIVNMDIVGVTSGGQSVEWTGNLPVGQYLWMGISNCQYVGATPDFCANKQFFEITGEPYPTEPWTVSAGGGDDTPTYAGFSQLSANSFVAGVGSAIQTSTLNVWPVMAAVLGIFIALFAIEWVIGLFEPPKVPTHARRKKK